MNFFEAGGHKEERRKEKGQSLRAPSGAPSTRWESLKETERARGGTFKKQWANLYTRRKPLVNSPQIILGEITPRCIVTRVPGSGGISKAVGKIPPLTDTGSSARWTLLLTRVHGGQKAEKGRILAVLDGEQGQPALRRR